MTDWNICIIIYGSISYFEKTKENIELDLIITRNKLNFSIEKHAYKEEIDLELCSLVKVIHTLQVTK